MVSIGQNQDTPNFSSGVVCPLSTKRIFRPSGKVVSRFDALRLTIPSLGDASNKPFELLFFISAKPSHHGINAGVCNRVAKLAGIFAPEAWRPMLAANEPISSMDAGLPVRSAFLKIRSIESFRNGKSIDFASICRHARHSCIDPDALIKGIWSFSAYWPISKSLVTGKFGALS